MNVFERVIIDMLKDLQTLATASPRYWNWVDIATRCPGAARGMDVVKQGLEVEPGIHPYDLPPGLYEFLTKE